jgi:hypothetical protein
MRCVIGYGFNGQGKIKAIRCGRWTCPDCAKWNAKQWAWRARIQIREDDRMYYHWTLTLGSKYKTPVQGFNDLPRLWNNLRMIVERHYRKTTGNPKWKWTYLAFVEGQAERNGMPHFHILSAVKSPYNKKKGWKRIKDFAAKNGFGHQATQDLVDGEKAQYYVTKYASKGDPAIPKNFRRCRPSQDWQKLPPYDIGKFLVPDKKESVSDFLLRVERITGADIDDLKDQWLDRQEWLREQQRRQENKNDKNA